MNWVNSETEVYCSFAKTAGNTGCQMMNSSFYYYGLNKIYKSFSVDNIQKAVDAVRTLNIKGFAITMPFKKEVVAFVDDMTDDVKNTGACNTVINDNGYLKAYNTDVFAAKAYLKDIDNNKILYILGDGGYASAVKYVATNMFECVYITRNDWDDIGKIKNSIIYNCTPVKNIDYCPSNIFINCDVNSKTGRNLAILQASKQFELYTNMKFPIGVL